MSFSRRHSKSFCNLTPKLNSGQRIIGGYLLNFSIDLHIFNVSKEEKEMPILLKDLTADLFCKIQRSEQLIGRLYSTQGPVIHQAYETSQDPAQGFSIKLSFSDLDEIEKERNGGELTFLFKLSGFIFEGDDYTRAWDDRSIIIEQSSWIKILDQMGYSKILTIEIPTSGEKSNPKYTLAYTKLSEAQQSMLRGEWRQAVALCRDCLETLPTFPTEEIIPSSKNTKSERLQLIQKLLHLTHLAKHSNNDVANTADWQREDALFMLATCGALVHKLSKSET